MELRNNLRRIGLIGLPLLSCAVVSPALAIDYSANALYRLESSDNIGRVTEAEGKTSGASQEIIGEFSGSTRAQQLDMDFDLSLGLSDGNGINGQQNTDLRGSLYALFNLRPGLISWLLADYAVEQGDDLAQLADRNERFLANYFVTGPSTRWRLSPVDTASLDLFYMLADEESDPEQTRQMVFQSDWSHRFSRQNTLGLHYEDTDISFKQSDDEFGIENVFARYSYLQGKTRFNVDAGKSRSSDLDSNANTETDRDENLYRIGFSRQLSRATTLTLNGSQVFTDETMSTVRDLQANLDGGLNTGSGPFYEKRVAIGVNRGGDIWSASLGLGTTNMEFVDDISRVNDRTENRANFQLGYKLSSVWGFHLLAGMADIEYDNVVRQDDELNFGVGLSYQLTETWGTSFEAYFDKLDRYRPNADTGLQEDVLIEEQGVNFTVSWQPITKLLRLREKYEKQEIENVLQ